MTLSLLLRRQLKLTLSRAGVIARHAVMAALVLGGTALWAS
jgi:hypothetical protein